MTDVIVVGGGIAGLATAAFLGERGLRVTLLERDAGLAGRSTAQSAGIFRTIVPDPMGMLLALRTRELAERLAPGSIESIGGVYLCDDERQRAALLDVTARVGSSLVTEDRLPESMRRDRMGIWSPIDGLIDVPRLVASLVDRIREQGVEVVTGAQVTRPEMAAGRARGVVAGERVWSADVVVDCMGAWSETFPSDASLPLQTVRRHAFLLERPAGFALPHVVWDLGDGVYVRPAADGIVASACDETRWDPRTPLTVDDGVEQVLKEKLRRFIPALAEVRVSRCWAGLRPVTRDQHFAIGEDPRVPGLWRVSGFGGHGLTGGLAAGEIAARMISGEVVEEARALSPARLLVQDA